MKPGRVMFELGGVNEATAKEALRLAANKLPIKCKFVTKETEGVSMKAAEIRELTADELNSKLADLRLSFLTCASSWRSISSIIPCASRPLEGHRRVKTVIRENELHAENA